MILINTHSKLSSRIAPMSINDIHPKQIMLIGLSSAKFLLCGVNVVHFSNDHNIASSITFRHKNKLSMEFLDPFFKFLKVNLGLGGKSKSLL